MVRDDKDIIKFVKIYIVSLLPFLFSVLLDFVGLRYIWPVLQTMKFEETPYVHWHGGLTLVMRNGLFRNPEPMGWYAMIGVAGALFLLFKVAKTLSARIFYISFSFLGLFCILLSGRRKLYK